MRRGTERVGWAFTIAAAAYNLVKLPKLLVAATSYPSTTTPQSCDAAVSTPIPRQTILQETARLQTEAFFSSLLRMQKLCQPYREKCTYNALDGHRMVGFRSSSTGAVLPLEFTSDGKVRTVMLPSTVTVSGGETYASAARAGLGLIQAPRYRLEEDFRRGALVPVLVATPPTRTPVSALYPRAKHLSLRLRVFLDWLAEQFRIGTADG